ncbi:MAG TPA: hypothetical protein VGX23_28250 [Actinocrinis sp.]|nr:hypothetical protein [Actinocrinis sp.]
MDWIEAPVSMVVVDDARFPERDTNSVFDHLVRYLAHFDPTPAIRVRLEADNLVLCGHHKYLRAARLLGRERITMDVVGADPESFARLLDRPGVAELDWAQIDREERARPQTDQWHVLYFDGALDEQAAARFRTEVVGPLFTDDRTPKQYTVDLADGVIEFLAPTPRESRPFASRFLAALRAYSSDVVKIVSYQGTKFDAR